MLYVLNPQNYISNPFIQVIFFETSERHYTFKHIRLPNFIIVMWIKGSREIPILHSSIFKRALTSSVEMFLKTPFKYKLV